MDMWILIEEAINVYLQFFFINKITKSGPNSDQCILYSSIFFFIYIYIYIVDEINTTAFNYTVFSHLKIPKR